VRALWRQPASRHLSIAVILLYTMALGLAPWYAAFMMRSHAMPTIDVGLWLGLIFGVGGIVGIALGGLSTRQRFAADERGQMRLTATMMMLLVPCFLLFLFLPQKQHALMALTPLIVAFNFFFAPTFSLMQRLVPDEIRATTLAIVMLLANLIGMGVGPQIVGTLSDLLMRTLGSDSLRYSMLCMSGVALWSAYHFWRVGDSVRQDLQTVADGTGSHEFA
jgi:predicted MFS family arabinose efflux permease